MTDLNPDRMAELAIEALERTAFVLAEPAESEDEFKPAYFARVGFTGAAEGHVVLAADGGFVSELASSMLGVEPEEVAPDTEGQQALNELANIVGGSVIIDLGGEKADYKYGLPEQIGPTDAGATNAGSVSGLVASEEGHLRVTWIPATARAAA